MTYSSLATQASQTVAGVDMAMRANQTAVVQKNNNNQSSIPQNSQQNLNSQPAQGVNFSPNLKPSTPQNASQKL